MSRSTRILARLYAALLKLYPRSYQVEYGQELQAVFNLALDDEARQGGFSPIWTSLRELRDLSGAIIIEHRRERRKHKMGTERASRLDFEPCSRRETLAALAPFLLGAFSATLAYLRLNSFGPQWVEVAIALSLLGSLGSLIVIGVVRRFPRWFLPYLGAALSLLGVYVIAGPVSLLFNVLTVPSEPWLFRQIIDQGLFWIGLLVAGLLVVLAARTLPPLRPFYWRIRRDWTLLSFVLYGTTLFALLLTFDDYQNKELYKTAALLVLAAGAWFYLQSAHSLQRLLALFAGLTLAMAVAAVGKAVLYSSPDWPSLRLFTWQTEAMSTVITWAWLVLVIFAPAWLGRLLPPDERLEAAGPRLIEHL